MLNSSTFEEAPPHLGPWFRQRTRWMKGYMQTLLVHSRHPAKLIRKLRVRGCFAFQLFLGGAVWSALVNPVLWAIFALSCLARPADPELLDMLARISGTTVFAANGLLAALSLADGRRPRGYACVPCVLSYPLYWILISAAAYRAVWQLMHDPFRWEKTPHGGASM
jgi:hypothetical protein